MKSKAYIVDRTLHWISAFLLLFMLMNLSGQLHNVNWDIKGQLTHRQEAVEIHALIGVILVGLTIARLIFYYLCKTSIQRITPESEKHALFIQTTHITMYLCIFLLAATGIALVNNYEIPLSVFGIDISPDKENFYKVFPKLHDIHIFLKQAIWWLIAIHFFGIMYAKK